MANYTAVRELADQMVVKAQEDGEPTMILTALQNACAEHCNKLFCLAAAGKTSINEEAGRQAKHWEKISAALAKLAVAI